MINQTQKLINDVEETYQEAKMYHESYDEASGELTDEHFEARSRLKQHLKDEYGEDILSKRGQKMMRAFTGMKDNSEETYNLDDFREEFLGGKEY